MKALNGGKAPRALDVQVVMDAVDSDGVRFLSSHHAQQMHVSPETFFPEWGDFLCRIQE